MRKFHPLILMGPLIIFNAMPAFADESLISSNDPLSQIGVYAPDYITTGAGTVFGGNVVAGAVTTGANSWFTGNISSTAAVTIAATNVVHGNVISSAATTTGDHAGIRGSITSGAGITIGASSSITGNIGAYGAITPGAGSTVGGTQTDLATEPNGQPIAAYKSNFSNYSDQIAQSVISLQTKLTAYGSGTAFPTSFDNPLSVGTYSAGSLTIAANTTLVLDFQGQSNRNFVFNISEFLALGASDKIQLINKGENDQVYWNIGNYLSVGASSVFTGTVVANGYISVGAGASVLSVDDLSGGLYSARSYVSTGDDANIGRLPDPTLTRASPLPIFQSPPSTITSSVPEPATWAMLIGGFGIIGGSLRSRRRKNRRSSGTSSLQ